MAALAKHTLAAPSGTTSRTLWDGRAYHQTHRLPDLTGMIRLLRTLLPGTAPLPVALRVGAWGPCAARRRLRSRGPAACCQRRRTGWSPSVSHWFFGVVRFGRAELGGT